MSCGKTSAADSTAKTIASVISGRLNLISLIVVRILFARLILTPFARQHKQVRLIND